MALIAQVTDPHLRDDGADPFDDPAQALQQAFAPSRGFGPGARRLDNPTSPSAL